MASLPQPAVRLPTWTVLVVVLGGIFTYWVAGTLLLDARLAADLDNIVRGSASPDPETIAPFVLLLIPAVLGALWTRENLRLIFRGVRRGDSAPVIVKELALYALSVAILVLVAFASSSRRK